MKVELIITGDTSNDQDLKALFAHLGGRGTSITLSGSVGSGTVVHVPTVSVTHTEDTADPDPEPDAPADPDPEPDAPAEPEAKPVTHAVVRNAARDLYKKTGNMVSVVEIIKEFVPDKEKPQVSDIAEEDLAAALAKINEQIGEHDAIG